MRWTNNARGCRAQSSELYAISFMPESLEASIHRQDPRLSRHPRWNDFILWPIPTKPPVLIFSAPEIRRTREESSERQKGPRTPRRMIDAATRTEDAGPHEEDPGEVAPPRGRPIPRRATPNNTPRNHRPITKQKAGVGGTTARSIGGECQIGPSAPSGHRIRNRSTAFYSPLVQPPSDVVGLHPPPPFLPSTLIPLTSSYWVRIQKGEGASFSAPR